MVNYPIIRRTPIPQASDIITDVNNFNKNLSASDTDVQLALDTIDELDILTKPVTTKTNDYTATNSDYTILIDTSDNAVTIYLPLSPDTGKILNIKVIDATNTATVDGNGKSVDSTATPQTYILHESITVQYDGTSWWII